MANMDLSLDDIIQKKFSKTAKIRGRYVKLCHICKEWMLFFEDERFAVCKSSIWYPPSSFIKLLCIDVPLGKSFMCETNP
jgi:hypothetical protein